MTGSTVLVFREPTLADAVAAEAAWLADLHALAERVGLHKLDDRPVVVDTTERD